MTLINVTVNPGAKKNRIIEQHDNMMKVDIKAAPENGKANLELIAFLQKQTGCCATIIRGKTSKKKLVRLSPTSA